MNQTVGTGWYAKRCVLGAVIALAVELAVLAAAALLLLKGAVGEESLDGMALIAAALGAFAGCSFAGMKTSRKVEIAALCVALIWLTAQVAGFVAYDGLEPMRSLLLAAAVLAGAAASLALHKGKKKRKRTARRSRR